MFHKRWQNKVLQAKCGSKRLSVLLENVHKTFSKRSQNVHKTFSKRSQNVHKAFSKRSRNVLKTFSKRSQNVLKTFTKRSQNVQKSSQNVHKTFSKRSQNVLKTFTKCSQNVFKTFTKRSKNVLKTSSKRSQNVLKTFTKPPITFHSLFIQNVSRKVCRTSRCYFMRHSEYKNVLSTNFGLPAGAMLRALRCLETLRDAARCQLLRAACTPNPTSAKHLSCSFRPVVLVRELSSFYRFLWGHREVKGFRHIQQATELLQQIVQ
jgi:uncharacterized membrane-anchored protein YhcB (DUF1043 family)